MCQTRTYTHLPSCCLGARDKNVFNTTGMSCSFEPENRTLYTVTLDGVEINTLSEERNDHNTCSYASTS